MGQRKEDNLIYSCLYLKEACLTRHPSQKCMCNTTQYFTFDLKKQTTICTERVFLLLDPGLHCWLIASCNTFSKIAQKSMQHKHYFSKAIIHKITIMYYSVTVSGNIKLSFSSEREACVTSAWHFSDLLGVGCQPLSCSELCIQD